jgi:Subtilase family
MPIHYRARSNERKEKIMKKQQKIAKKPQKLNQPPKLKSHKRYSFVGNVIVFEVTHPVASTAQEQEEIKQTIVQLVQSYLDENFSPEEPNNDKPPADSDWRLRLQPPIETSRIIMFPQVEGSQPFSLVPLKLKGHPKEDRTYEDVMNLLNAAYTELEGVFINPEPQGEENFLTISLDPSDPESEFQLKSISADWLSSDLHHGKATGGPGSVPARRAAPTGTQHKFQLKGSDALDSLVPFRKPGAHVAILDTIRPLTDYPSHLINNVFNGMRVVPYTPQDALDQEVWDSLGFYTEFPSHYFMPDHGPFVASIVRFIAPTATISLYEVLTQFGIGSFVSVARGVLDAINQRVGGTHLVLNCSFALDHDLSDLAAKMNLETLQKSGIITLLEMAMRDVFSWATNPSHDVTVVASAGNDKRLSPAYPAAFNDVLSVAAVPKSYPTDTAGYYKRAPYSNRAHDPASSKGPQYSFAAFGGARADATLRPDSGVMGVYIGVFPRRNTDGTFSQNGTANTTGYGQWSGTSFAAPVITGYIAAQNSDLVINPTTPHGPYRTRNLENVIPLKQG